jgi:hypothetical protein
LLSRNNITSPAQVKRELEAEQLAIAAASAVEEPKKKRIWPFGGKTDSVSVVPK